MFRKEAKIEVAHIPYKGAGEAMTGIISNQVDLLITASPTAMGQIKGGKIRALAVTGAKRSPAFPDVPTFGEIGLPGYAVTGWFGLAVPKGTPKDVIAKFSAAALEAMADPEVRKRLADLGQDIPAPELLTSEALGIFYKAEIAKWWPIIREAGIKVE
jgi:tripartite-type tricarboxylate transporter receptor subunit TctC